MDTPISVLLVEDSDADTHTLELALATAGAGQFRLTCVESLAEALPLLSNNGIDVLLLDLSRPDARGLELVTRAHAAAPDAPIVVLTGLDDEATAIQAVQAGAQDYLVKGNVEGTLLVRAVRHAIERKRIEDVQRGLAAENARLLHAEQQARERAEQAAGRMALLQGVTAALSEALTPAQVGEVITTRGLPSVGAQAGGVLRLSADGAELDMLSAFGVEDEVLSPWRAFPLSVNVPASEAVRTATAVWVESVEDALERYPALEQSLTRAGSRALAALPLIVEGRVIGAITLAFTAERPLTAVDQSYVLALSRLCAQALERARLFESERAARAEAEAAHQRIAFLAEASAVLAGSLEYETTLSSVAHLAVPAVADWCIIDLLDAEGTLQRLAVAHSDPARAGWAEELERRFPATPQALAARISAAESGHGVLVPEISDEMLGNLVVNEDHLALVRELGMRAAMAVPFRARGRTLGTILLIAAESDRRYGPADLALAEELARRSAMAIDNARLYRDAQQALRLRDEFLTSISHDLRTPLTTIKGMAQLLTRSATKLAAGPAEMMGGGLARIDGAATRMVALVDDLLDLGRLQSGRPMTLNRQPAEIVALTRRVAAEHQQGSPYHRIQVDASAEEITGAWDAGRLERVLTNLLSNAIKYSPDGGNIHVRLRQEPPAGDQRAQVRVTVQDQGIGIPSADLPRVFERFRRGSNVPPRVSGTGIGLAGSRQIVEAHGGRIEVESDEGHGTTVTVLLPLA